MIGNISQGHAETLNREIVEWCKSTSLQEDDQSLYKQDFDLKRTEFSQVYI